MCQARTCQANEIETRTEKYGNAPNRKKPNEFPLADIHRLRTHSTFSGVVISLYKEKTRLEKAKNDPNISPKIKSETQLKITAILRQLEALKKVAGSYKVSDFLSYANLVGNFLLEFMMHCKLCHRCVFPLLNYW